MKIICFGDSLTFGSIGHSYLEYLIGAFELCNKGVNGDTPSRMMQRLQRYFASNPLEAADPILVCIGTNDLLLPYLSTLSPLWKTIMTPRSRVMRCLRCDDDFAATYEKLILEILSHGRRMVVLGLPHLELLGFPNERVDARNQILRALCEKHALPFVDVAGCLDRIAPEAPVAYSWRHSPLMRLWDGILFPIFPPLKNRLSERRGLALTTDGVHWNSQAAVAVATETASVLHSLLPPNFFQ